MAAKRQEPFTYRVISVTRYGGEGMRDTRKICIKKGDQRIHLLMNWSGYCGDPLSEEGAGATLVYFSPCDCDKHVKKSAPWLEKLANRYLQDHNGKKVTVERTWQKPCTKDAHLGQWTWKKDSTKD